MTSTFHALKGEACTFTGTKDRVTGSIVTGLLSNQGEKSINFYFIMVPLRKCIKVWYSKAQVIA